MDWQNSKFYKFLFYFKITFVSNNKKTIQKKSPTPESEPRPLGHMGLLENCAVKGQLDSE